MTGNPGFAEYRTVKGTDPLRQGDVLERTGDDSTAWNRHLLVITADCDLAHGKNRGRVTCVPLLAKDEFLLELIMPKLRDIAAKKLVAGLKGLLSTFSAPDISETRLREWPHEQSVEDILSLLSVPNDHLVVVGKILEGIRVLGSSPDTLAEATNLLVQAHGTLPNAQSEKNIRSQVVARLKDAFKQPPGDALFLSALAVGHHHGYFAYLRHLEQIWEPQIALGPTRSVVDYRRLSRLQDKYVHAIAQRFALVFMSIGLPDSYEEMRDLHADLIGEEIA